jgi:hypothetical protein
LVRADRLARLFAFALPCALLAGCGPANDDGIKTYRVATHKGAGVGGGGDPEPKLPPDDGPPKVRFLGGIIPVGDKSSYFVRFGLPLDIEKIDPLEKDFDAFLSSIRVPGEGGKPVSWTVPPGWKEVPNPPEAAGLRVVSIRKADDSSPDLYISTPIPGTVLENVNRWRTDFAGIRRVTDAELKAMTKEQKGIKEQKFGEKAGYRVDFRGPGGKSSRGKPPFAPK